MAQKLNSLTNPIKTEVKEALEKQRKSLFEDGLEDRVYENTLYFDSKSRSGIDDLEKTLVELAWSDPEKAQMVPKRWTEFQHFIKNEKIFALPEDKLIEIASIRLPNLKKVRGAIKMFVLWGLLYRLSNGDIASEACRCACPCFYDACQLNSEAKARIHTSQR